jgi:hypothetical protein
MQQRAYAALLRLTEIPSLYRVFHRFMPANLTESSHPLSVCLPNLPPQPGTECNPNRIKEVV